MCSKSGPAAIDKLVELFEKHHDEGQAGPRLWAADELGWADVSVDVSVW